LHQDSENAHQICGAISRKALSATRESNEVDSLQQQISQQEKFIDHLQRNLKTCEEKIEMLLAELRVFADMTGNESDTPLMDPTLKELSENNALSPSVNTKKLMQKGEKCSEVSKPWRRNIQKA